MFKDPLIKRFLSGSLFAAAFIWVAVTQFDVETEVIRVFFILSFIFVGGMIVIGMVLAPLARLIARRTRRRSSTLLDSLDDIDRETGPETDGVDDQAPPVDRG